MNNELQNLKEQVVTKIINKTIDRELQIARTEIFVSGLLFETEVQLEIELTMKQRNTLLTILAETMLSDMIAEMYNDRDYVMELLENELLIIRKEIISDLKQNFPNEIPNNKKEEKLFCDTIDKEILMSFITYDDYFDEYFKFKDSNYFEENEEYNDEDNEDDEEDYLL